MSTVHARPASSRSHALAEGPVWDDRAGLLRWVDIDSGEVFAGTLRGDRIEILGSEVVDESVGAVVPGPDGRVLVAGRERLVVVEPDGARTAGQSILDTGSGSRLNDGACDPAGRFVIGSLSLIGRAGAEVLCRVEDDGSISTLDDDLTLSNGLAWSPDGATMYSIDTTPGAVWRRSYDVASGAVGPRTEHLRITDGSPDGMCADAAGDLWIALWGAGQVRCYAPDGAVRQVVELSAPQPTSVTFAGPALDVLVISTASVGLAPSEVGDSGRLFTARVEARGRPGTPWNGRSIPRARG